MKKVICKLFCFLLLLITSELLSRPLFSLIYKNTQGGLTAVSRHIFEDIEADIVILGSSRARHHYIPAILKDSLNMSCYNCGLDGNGIISMYGIYEIVSQRHKPKVVIYDVHESFDIEQNDNTKYLPALRMAYDYSGIDSIFFEISPNEKIKMISNLYRYNSKLLGFLADMKTPFDSVQCGFSPLVGEMTNTKGREYKELLFDKTKKLYINKLIKKCKSDGTILIFFFSPRYKGNVMSFIPFVNYVQQFDVVLFDCFNLYDDCPYLFYDAGHLNEKGAMKYSSIVASRIRQIMKKSK